MRVVGTQRKPLVVFDSFFSYTFCMDVPAPVHIETIFTPAKTFNTVGSLTNVIVKNAFVVAGVIFLFLLIFGGFGYIVSAGNGDAKKMEQGKQAITSALIGLLIVFASYWIVQIVGIITGIKLI